MRTILSAACGIAAILVLASCASKPEPIKPEPIFDKYGNSVGDVCRDGRQSYSPNDPRSRLPICEDSCEEGYTPGANYEICVPITQRQGGDGGNQTGRTGQTGGQTTTGQN